ncbi:D-alanine--poly(phosphoribitol) ligase subunit DltC [Lactobacillus sp. R2/2]|nr:D-alanine--poly(phosphoribitol) ligase subunit DltC [Lactobacillus sp. R2/2]
MVWLEISSELLRSFYHGYQKEVLAILQDLTGEDLTDRMDENIFANGLMDSMASVQMLLNLQEKFQIDVPVSEFDRNEWDTPNKIVAKVENLENE